MAKPLVDALQKISELAYAIAETDDDKFVLLVAIRDVAQDGMKGWREEKAAADRAEAKRLQALVDAKRDA